MIEQLFTNPVIRPGLTITVMILLLGLESWVPFRAHVQLRLRHIATNLSILVSNGLVVSLLTGGFLLLLCRQAEGEGWGLLHLFGLGSGLNLLASVVLLDLVLYGLHWGNHSVPFFWRFHRGHHSDLDLDVTTAVRFHFGELVISTGVKAASVVALGIPPAGLILFEMVLLTQAQIQHSNLRLPQPLESWVRVLLVTPDMHRIHHSRLPREHNRNFGTILSGWDRLFRTYFVQTRQENIRIGLDEYPSPEHVSLSRFFAMPLGTGCQGGLYGP
jgi:sterol desaturase/sphingolipid hydroxylase (fatty acid hydroxylase superfamily)